MIQESDYYVKNCMKAWLICEACVYMELAAGKPDEEVLNSCYGCAEACFGLMYQLISNRDTDLIDKLAFLCFLHCRHCAEVCSTYKDVEDLQYCQMACTSCSLVIKDLLIPINLN